MFRRRDDGPAFSLLRREKSSGFSLAEVLVALAVAAMLAAVLTRYVAGTRFNATQVRERLELWTLAQSMLDSLPPQLSPGATSGRRGIYQWRIDVAPITVHPLARVEASHAPAPGSASSQSPETAQGVAAPAPPGNPWAPYRVSVRIEAPSGRQYATDTIRLGR